MSSSNTIAPKQKGRATRSTVDLTLNLFELDDNTAQPQPSPPGSPDDAPVTDDDMQTMLSNILSVIWAKDLANDKVGFAGHYTWTEESKPRVIAYGITIRDAVQDEAKHKTRIDQPVEEKLRKTLQGLDDQTNTAEGKSKTKRPTETTTEKLAEDKKKAEETAAGLKFEALHVRYKLVLGKPYVVASDFKGRKPIAVVDILQRASQARIPDDAAISSNLQDEWAGTCNDIITCTPHLIDWLQSYALLWVSLIKPDAAIQAKLKENGITVGDDWVQVSLDALLDFYHGFYYGKDGALTPGRVQYIYQALQQRIRSNAEYKPVMPKDGKKGKTGAMGARKKAGGGNRQILGEGKTDVATTARSRSIGKAPAGTDVELDNNDQHDLGEPKLKESKGKGKAKLVRKPLVESSDEEDNDGADMKGNQEVVTLEQEHSDMEEPARKIRRKQ